MKPFTTIFANRKPKAERKGEKEKIFLLPGTTWITAYTIHPIRVIVQKRTKSRSRGSHVPTALRPLLCVDDGDDGSEKGRVRVLGNCCYFPADSVVLTCCVMVGRDGLSACGWTDANRWDDDLVRES